MATILVLIVVEPGKKDHRVLLQRRLSLLDQPVKLHRSVKWDQFVCAFDIPLTQLSDMKHYHNNVAPMFSIFKGCMIESSTRKPRSIRSIRDSHETSQKWLVP
jgi:hypothetical protein